MGLRCLVIRTSRAGCVDVSRHLSLEREVCLGLVASSRGDRSRRLSISHACFDRPLPSDLYSGQSSEGPHRSLLLALRHSLPSITPSDCTRHW